MQECIGLITHYTAALSLLNSLICLQCSSNSIAFMGCKGFTRWAVVFSVFFRADNKSE